MKTLSAALIAELGLTVTRPGYLIEVGYSAVLRLSTLGDLSWNAQIWSGFDARVSGLAQDGKGGGAGMLSLGNTDGAIGALALNEGASDIMVGIWAVYAGATATGDPVQVFAGVLDGCAIAPDKVTFTLAAQGNLTLESPRYFISQLNGFNWLKPAGSVIPIGGELFPLPRHT